MAFAEKSSEKSVSEICPETANCNKKSIARAGSLANFLKQVSKRSHEKTFPVIPVGLVVIVLGVGRIQIEPRTAVNRRVGSGANAAG